MGHLLVGMGEEFYWVRNFNREGGAWGTWYKCVCVCETKIHALSIPPPHPTVSPKACVRDLELAVAHFAEESDRLDIDQLRSNGAQCGKTMVDGHACSSEVCGGGGRIVVPKMGRICYLAWYGSFGSLATDDRERWNENYSPTNRCIYMPTQEVSTHTHTHTHTHTRITYLNLSDKSDKRGGGRDNVVFEQCKGLGCNTPPATLGEIRWIS